ncbi:CaiB/BaiF CoA transferase family protein [Hyphomonas johnsonii]|uniref:Succinyl-CoA:(R)-citramalate CoA-transferase n=1 Tax=Hyphomonas johnsonii MHS-2 TaxID=1280950 RepID=A0A059FE03_9PROT|nr:CoA transferase [Hyphomonas johnsonii]KCZ88849.1 succinyl-CoA:(R)-citramalate CoA-transferase [Hyphomonas johnsonii MHS-2]
MDREGALAGLKVIELGQLIAGPFCGQLLGDMGADVVKVEAPGGGDPMRNWGSGEHKVWWDVIARNKRSVTADLRRAEGQDLVRKLVAEADIVIENFRPGKLESWGLGPEQLLEGNPRLIIVRMSGYGQTGPYASRPGFGGVAEAMGGWRAIVGEPDRPPSRMGVSIGDTLGATFGCMGVLAALHARTRTGRGQIIDVALYECVLQVMESQIAEYDVSGLVRQRSGSILPGIAPSNVYPCRDGEYMIAANADGIFARLCDTMGQPELARDPRFADHVSRGRHQSDLDGIVSAWTGQFLIAELEEKMIDNAIPAGRVYSPADIVSDPHIAARQAVVSVPHAVHGSIKMQNCVPVLSDTPSRIRRSAPTRPGQHNAEIYTELGIDASDLRTLEAGGVI